jgi:hypothetical protein
MNDPIANVMVHVNESLDEEALHALEDDIRRDQGVVSVGHNPHRPHLLMVAYDSEAAPTSNLLHPFRQRGLHAQLVGF